MPTYTITAKRTAAQTATFAIEAESEEDATDQAQTEAENLDDEKWSVEDAWNLKLGDPELVEKDGDKKSTAKNDEEAS